MTKTVTNIDCPKEWESDDDYSSHRPALWLAMENNTRSVCEMGCGKGSTKLLSRYCKKNHHTFTSYETNEVYAKPFGDIVTLVNDYNEIELSDFQNRIGVLFIDLAPGELRKVMIENHFTHADVLVIHDTEIGAEYVYGMKKILDCFTYRINYEPEGKPHTTIVSQFVNVCEWIR